MFSCTRNETKLIQEGRATSVTRQYGKSCPHEPGAQIVLTSRYVGPPDEGEIPFAVATITSVRPATIAEMRRDERLCKMDGFSGPAEWHGHFLRMYPGAQDDTAVHRLQLRIDEMDKDVADRVRQARTEASEQVEVG